jgi:hypothetical protein
LEAFWARHFGTNLGTPKATAFPFDNGHECKKPPRPTAPAFTGAFSFAPLPSGSHHDASDRPEHGTLQHDLNDIGVRSFILAGAPLRHEPGHAKIHCFSALCGDERKKPPPPTTPASTGGNSGLRNGAAVGGLNVVETEPVADHGFRT